MSASAPAPASAPSTMFLKNMYEATPTIQETSNSVILKIPRHNIKASNTESNRINYNVSIAPSLSEFTNMWALCGIKVSTNTTEALGFFCEKVDKTGFQESLFGFPGDFFMGQRNIWAEPTYPIPRMLATISNLVIKIPLGLDCDFPDVEIRLCAFRDINNIYPQVFMYKTQKNENNCAVVGGIYYPSRGFIQTKFLQTKLLPPTYKIIPSIKILKNDWKDDTLIQTEFSTVDQLEEAVTNGRFGGGFITHSDVETD
jgi:hypothetical protein